jgi:MFS family permease
MAFVLSGMNFGLLVSPFLGGVIYEKLGYNAVFYTSFSVIAFAFLWRLVTVEQATAAKWMEAGSRQAPHGMGSNDHEDTDFGQSSTTLARSNERQQQASEPSEHTALLPNIRGTPISKFTRNYSTMAILIGSPRLKAAVYGSFTLFVLTTAFDGILPLFVIRTYSWNASGAGLIFLAITCPSIFGVIFGVLSDRFGPKRVGLAGFGTTTFALCLLSLTANNSIVSQVLLCIFLAFIGLPLSVCRVGRNLAADIFDRYRMQSHISCSCGRLIF